MHVFIQKFKNLKMVDVLTSSDVKNILFETINIHYKKLHNIPTSYLTYYCAFLFFLQTAALTV